MMPTVVLFVVEKEKSYAALQLLLFSVAVRLPGYTSRGSAKGPLDIHSLLFSLNFDGTLDK